MQLLKVIVRRLNNYSVASKNKTFDEIVESLRKTMVGYEVLGTPEGRLWRIREIASHILSRSNQKKPPLKKRG